MALSADVGRRKGVIAMGSIVGIAKQLDEGQETLIARLDKIIEQQDEIIFLLKAKG